MLVQLHLIRAFEETVLELAGEGLVHGPAHSSVGQEGGAVGSIVGLRASDAINGSHRGHHQFLSKALSYVAPDGLDSSSPCQRRGSGCPAENVGRNLGPLPRDSARVAVVPCTLNGTKRGVWARTPSSAEGVPLAAGNAWAQKHSHTDDLTVTYFGDGAVNIGSVLEA